MSMMLTPRNVSAPKTQQEMLQAFSSSPTLRNVVGRISETVSSVAWRAFATRGDQKIEVNHPLTTLLNNGMNPQMPGRTGIALLQQWLDVIGEGFVALDVNERGEPTAIWPIPPSCVSRVPSVSDPTYDVKINGAASRPTTEHMKWVKKIDPANPYGRGVGVAQSLGDELSTDEHVAKHVLSLYVNNAVPSMIISLDDVGEPEAEIARQRFEERNRGPIRAGRVHFTGSGMTAVKLNDSIESQQVIQMREFIAQTVRETYNVPPEAVGHVENSTRANMAHAQEWMGQIADNALELLLVQLINPLLAMYRDGDKVTIEYDSPIPANQETRAEIAKSSPWALTLDEHRAIAGLPPIGGVQGGSRPVLSGLTFVGTEQKSDPLSFGELSLAINRLASVGDVDGINAMRAVIAQQLGLPSLPPLTSDAIAAAQAATPASASKMFRKAITTTEAIDAATEVQAVQVGSDELERHVRDIVEAFGEDALKEVGVSIAFNMRDPRVFDHIANFSSTRIVGIDDTTEKDIREALLDGVAQGEGPRALQRRIRSLVEQTYKNRALTIARTEVLHSSNFARLQGFNDSGVVSGKRWLSTQDARTRDTHRAINGQRRAIEDNFAVGSDKMLNPGGGSVAKENINCRCTMLAVLDNEDENSFSDQVQKAQWQKFDRMAARFEGTFEDTMMLRLEAQADAVIKKLGEIE